MFDDKGGEMYPKSKQVMPLARGNAISKGEEWKMQCKRMHGDRGRYLVNMGEKYNLMIPWTKVQKFSLLIWFKPHTSHCSTIFSTIGIKDFLKNEH